MTMHLLETDSVRVVFNPDGGHLDDVVFRHGGREIRPMHRAPWRDGETLPDDTPTILRSLAGDFFCAPFCEPDVEPAPWHGWSANGWWHLDSETKLPDGITARFRLDHRILGAAVFKEITLRAGHPLVYQRHIFAGGSGALPVAHHAMIRTAGGVRLSFSEKLFGGTPEAPVETDPKLGRSALAYPQRFERLDAVRTAAGATVDARSYPFDHGHEDLIFLVDPPGTRFAWSAAVAEEQGFVFLAVKNARVLPQTMLWLSNGGRTYSPWLGRHADVLGIEEVCSYFGAGHRRSIEPNPVSDIGSPTAIRLNPDGEVSIAYAFGALPAAPGWEEVEEIAREGDQLTIRLRPGAAISVPFDPAFLPDA